MMPAFGLPDPIIWTDLLIYTGVIAVFMIHATLILTFFPKAGGWNASGKGQLPNLDGLRGFLALTILIHHGVVAYYEKITFIWVMPPSRFFGTTGEISVDLFFIITAFLFWQKAILAKGRFNLLSFYTSRYLRLAPAYFASILLVLFVLQIPFRNTLPPPLELQDLLDILFFKGFRAGVPVNTVYWTLIWEWEFYLLLPVAALCVSKFWPVLPMALLVMFIETHPGTTFLFNFVCGAIVAMLVQKYPAGRILEKPVFSLLALAVLGFNIMCFSTGYTYTQVGLAALFFTCIAYGNTLFGLLTSAPALLLGTISYSIYLLHCIVIYLTAHTLNLYVPLRNINLTQYWPFLTLQGLITITVALFFYRYLEHPFIRRRKH